MTSLQNAWVVFDKPIKYLIKLCGYVGKILRRAGEQPPAIRPHLLRPSAGQAALH